MAGSARRIVVEFIGDGKNLSGELNDLEGKTSKFGGTMGKVGKAAGLALAGGAVLGGKALFDMGQKAGDLNETISKTDQIFGSASGGLQKWAKTADQNLGMSQQTALDAAATFGTFGKAAGKTGNDLASFAADNTKLAADLASFNNSTPEQAIEALGAAFRGESEPLRSFGVLLDDASMRQQALKMGLVETTTQALTPQQKVLAAQGLIMKQTSDAQGDFERTSGGLANQQRILKAEFENMQVSVGQKVLPILLQMATFANDTLVPAMGKIGTWIEANVVPALQKMGGWIQSHVMPAFQQIGGQAPGIFDKVRQVIDAVVPVVVKIAKTVAENMRPVFEQLVATFRGSVLPTVEKIITRFQEWWPTISKVVTKFYDLASTIAGTVLPPVIKLAGFLLEKAVPAILDTIEVAAKIVGAMFDVGKAFVDAVKDVAKFVQGVTEKIGNVIGFIKEIPGKAQAALGNIGNALKQAGINLIQGLIDGIWDKVEDLKGVLSKVTNLIPDWKGPADKDAILLRPAGVAIMQGLINGINKGKVPLQKVLGKVTDYIKKHGDKLADLMSKRQSVIDAFGGMTSNLFSTDLSTAEGEAPPTVQRLLDAGRQRASNAGALSSNVQRLIGMGLSKDLLRQMIDAGEAGAQQIALLASGTQADIDAANAANEQTRAALEAAGLAVGDAIYGAQIKQEEAFIKQADIIRDKLKELLDLQDKNTIVELHLDGQKIYVSLKKLKKQLGKGLDLD